MEIWKMTESRTEYLNRKPNKESAEISMGVEL